MTVAATGGSAAPTIHCPECGSYTRRDRDADDFEYAICTDDDCPRIVVLLLSAPEPFNAVPSGARPE